VAWLLVAVQLFLLAALLVLPGGRGWATPWWLIAGSTLMITAAGLLALAGAVRLGTGLTASPLPSDRAELRTTGVYAWVRHPIYAALLLGGAGVVLLAARPSRIWVWLALLALLWGKSVLEERALTRRFPDYQGYAANTPRLLPSPRRRLHRTPTDRPS
jgi:protein-S-isoprenylcysteine O-methyltransferase Ste14